MKETTLIKLLCSEVQEQNFNFGTSLVLVL